MGARGPVCPPWNLLLFPGVIIPSLAPADSENNDVSSSEGKTEQGEERKEEESPGSSKELENPEESGASWTIQMVSESHLLCLPRCFSHPLLCFKLFPDVTSLVPGVGHLSVTKQKNQ